MTPQRLGSRVFDFAAPALLGAALGGLTVWAYTGFRPLGAVIGAVAGAATVALLIWSSKHP